MKNTPARLWIMPAKEAPVALVIRRKPHKTRHFLRWDLTNGTVESGDWAWGIFYPRGCDISWGGNHWTYHGDFGEKGSGLAPISRHAPTATWFSSGAWAGGGFFDSPTSLLRSIAWYDRPRHATAQMKDTGVLRLRSTKENIEWLRLQRDGWQSQDPITPKRMQAWQQPSPAHPRLTMNKAWTDDRGNVYDFNLPGQPNLFGPGVFWATYDSAGQLLVARRGS